MVLDPFVGTGGILVACGHFGAFCVGTDIDIRILRGKGGKSIFTNFQQYGLPPPELIRSGKESCTRVHRLLAVPGPERGLLAPLAVSSLARGPLSQIMRSIVATSGASSSTTLSCAILRMVSGSSPHFRPLFWPLAPAFSQHAIACFPPDLVVSSQGGGTPIRKPEGGRQALAPRHQA